ncbi:TPA: hypothetical protein ACT2HZ_001780, partial [Streptococcus suis]
CSAMTVPADSTLPGEGGDVPVIPHVPGYVSVNPGANEPLKPVNPEDPSKGYIPPVPGKPGEDTLIPYVPVKDDGQPGDPGTDNKPGGPMVVVTTQVPTLQHNHLQLDNCQTLVNLHQ